MSTMPTEAATHQDRDLLATGVLALVCAAATSLTGVPPLRIGAGLLLELVLPGYAITALVRDRRSLRASELLMCVIGASLVTAALGGLVLDVLPGHMGRAEWAVLLPVVTVAAAAVAVLRPPAPAALGAPDGANPADGAVARAMRPPRAPSGRALANGLIGVLALAVAVVAVLVARHAADHQPGFVELSMLPATSAPRAELHVGITNREPHTVRLVAIARADGTPVASFPVSLVPGGEWHLALPHPKPTVSQVRVDVYRAGSSAPSLHTTYYQPAALVAAARAAQRPRTASPARRRRARQAHRSGGSGR
jgi:uncharacterized membrane protein